MMNISLYDIKLFRVRKSWNDIKSQTGTFFDLENAIVAAKKSGQNVYDNHKRCIWSFKENMKNDRI